MFWIILIFLVETWVIFIGALIKSAEAFFTRAPIMIRDFTVFIPTEAFKPVVDDLVYFVVFPLYVCSPKTQINFCETIPCFICLRWIAWCLAISVVEAAFHHATHKFYHMAVITPLLDFFLL